MKELDKEQSAILYKRLKKADDKKALLNILRKAEFYISLFDILDIFSKLKSNIPVKISESTYYLINEKLKEWELTESLPPEDITLTIKGFNEVQEAEEFCAWYSGQGEQNAYNWFECRVDEGVISTRCMNESSTNTIDKNNVVMYLEMYK